MKTERNEDRQVKKQLFKLISEEFLAWQFYTQLTWAADAEVSLQFKELFDTIAVDEFNDHLTKLISYCTANSYDIPCTNEEYLKYASEDIAKQFQSAIKRHKDVLYYINIAIEAENSAIQSYQQTLNEGNLPDDLNSIVLQNYYDEQEHLQDLTTIKFAAECKYRPDIQLDN